MWPWFSCVWRTFPFSQGPSSDNTSLYIYATQDSDGRRVSERVAEHDHIVRTLWETPDSNMTTWPKIQVITRSYYTTNHSWCFNGVVVITLSSHGKGLEFEPRLKHVFLFLALWTSCTAVRISHRFGLFCWTGSKLLLLSRPSSVIVKRTGAPLWEPFTSIASLRGLNIYFGYWSKTMLKVLVSGDHGRWSAQSRVIPWSLV